MRSLIILIGLFSLTSKQVHAEDLSASGDNKGNVLWRDEGGTSGKDLTVFEPIRPSNEYYLLGQRAQTNYNENVEKTVHSFRDSSRRKDALVRPTAFKFIWDDRGSTYFDDASIWRPICPRGYESVGDFFARANRLKQPPNELFLKVRCVANDLIQKCDLGNLIWNNAGTIGEFYTSLWTVKIRDAGQFDAGFFYANNEHNEKPSDVTPWCLRNTL